MIFTSLLSDYRTWNDKYIALNYEIDAIYNKYLNKQRKRFIIEDIGSILYSEKEKINYCSTPMFLVKAVKG